MEEHKEDSNLNSPDAPIEESSSRIPTCRICYDTEKDDNPLLHPCRCTGSVRNVHEECLKTWLLSSNEDLNNRACELCHTTFLMSYSVISYVSCKEMCEETVGTCMFIPILLSILGLIVVIIYFLSVKYRSPDTTQSDKIYSFALMLGCSLAALIILVILSYIVKATLIRRRMEDWKILNQDFSADNQEKVGEEDHTLFTQGVENGGNVLVLQKSAKIAGKKIKAPKVVPLSLVPVYNGSKLIGYKSEIRDPGVQSCIIKPPGHNSTSKIMPHSIEKLNATL
jgi:hypothetical protein